MPLPGSEREKRFLQEIVEPEKKIPDPELLQEIVEPEKQKRTTRKRQKKES